MDVKNTGKVAGKESILLFSSDLVASMVPDGRRLRAFDKVELQPGETKTVTFELKADDLAFVGWDGKWRLEEGDVQVDDCRPKLLLFIVQILICGRQPIDKHI